MGTNEKHDVGDPNVIVHVETSEQSCSTCGSSNVLTVRIPDEDSPIWVQMCSDCEERIWSLDAEDSSD